MADKVQVCVFDMSRGQVEGQELDKILFFFPSVCPLPSQLSVVGLSEGLITFSRMGERLIDPTEIPAKLARWIFSPQSPCELMEAERHTHVFYQCEPDLWIVMVVEKNKEIEEAPRVAALRGVLQDAHNLFTLFYGSIRALLQAHPGGDVARSCLHAFLPDYLADFVTAKKFRLPSISESLTNRGMVQFFVPQRETLLEAQSLQELLKSWFAGGMVRHVVILFQNILLSSTLPPGDTATLFLYATLQWMPSMLSQGPSSRSSSRRDQPAATMTPNSFVSNAIGPSRLRNLFNNLSTYQSYEETVDAHIPNLHDMSVEDQGFKSSVPRPLSPEAWWRGGDGFLGTDVWGTGMKGSKVPPTVWLPSSEERMHLCVYQYKSLTFVMLAPTTSSPEAISHLQGHLLEKAAHKIQNLEEKLVKEWPGSNAYHVPGYRYLYCDFNNKVSKFSPASKVATLSMESLAALNRIREEVDLETARLERSTPGHDRELELCVRTKQNAWIIVRTRGDYELYTVLEKASNTLLLACDAVEKLNKRYFCGMFASD